jgi:hypothetical protein
MPIVAPRQRSNIAETVLTSGAGSRARELARNPEKTSLALLVTAVAILGFIGLLVASAYAGEAATGMRVGALVWLAALGAIRAAVIWRRPIRRDPD